MIATLSGKITEKHLNNVVVEVAGIGYEVLVTDETLSKMQLNEDVKLQIYEHIRENMYDLYGFLDKTIKLLFIQLINVNGVGPKAGLNILSIGPVDQVKKAIAGGDIKFIQSATGVGKKVAERVVIDLKDKVGLISTADEKTLLMSEELIAEDEAIQALMSLGYTTIDAVKAVENIDTNLTVSERVRLALKSK
jgi:Holliday junction DNA helicase RuvA